jgi:hypothetical protein
MRAYQRLPKLRYFSLADALELIDQQILLDPDLRRRFDMLKTATAAHAVMRAQRINPIGRAT